MLWVGWYGFNAGSAVAQALGASAESVDKGAVLGAEL